MAAYIVAGVLVYLGLVVLFAAALARSAGKPWPTRAAYERLHR